MHALPIIYRIGKGIFLTEMIAQRFTYISPTSLYSQMIQRLIQTLPQKPFTQNQRMDFLVLTNEYLAHMNISPLSNSTYNLIHLEALSGQDLSRIYEKQRDLIFRLLDIQNDLIEELHFLKQSHPANQDAIRSIEAQSTAANELFRSLLSFNDQIEKQCNKIKNEKSQNAIANKKTTLELFNKFPKLKVQLTELSQTNTKKILQLLNKIQEDNVVIQSQQQKLIAKVRFPLKILTLMHLFLDMTLINTNKINTNKSIQC